MHPAICSHVFPAGLENLAIGMVGSSDVVNNLLIGALSNVLLNQFGWQGYFVSLSTLATLVFVVTLLFPCEKKAISRAKEEEAKRTSEKIEPHVKFGLSNAVLY